MASGLVGACGALAGLVVAAGLLGGWLVQEAVVAGQDRVGRSKRASAPIGITPAGGWRSAMRRASTSTTTASVTPASMAWRIAWTSASVGRWRWASSTSISALVPAVSPCLRRAAVQNA